MCHGCHDDLFSISLHLCRLLAQAAAKKRSVWLCGDPHMSRVQRNPMKRLEHRSLTSSPDFVARKSAETLIRASRIADTKRWDLNGFDQGYRETSMDIECYFNWHAPDSKLLHGYPPYESITCFVVSSVNIPGQNGLNLN